MILEDYLRLYATECPHKIAVIDSNGSTTYGQLLAVVEKCAERLADDADRFIVFRAQQSIDFLVTYFAAHLAGKIAVPLEHDVPDSVVEELRGGLKELPLESVPSDVADILFTTGTTGRQKGVMISHSTIVADAENLIAAQGFTHELTYVVSGPLNHIGSLSKIYPMIYLGGTIAITEGMKDMESFFKAIDGAPCKAATFLVPASIRMLMQFAEDRLRLCGSKIDFIETGAAPITEADMRRLCGLLPDSRLYNTYASTETGIVATYNFNDGECVAGCLGTPMRHSQILVAADGHISCKGKTLMSGYVGDEKLTRNVLYDGSVHTSDLGYIDDKGRLHLSGRDGDVINIGGYKVSPTEVEDAAMACEEIADCVCIASAHPVMGTVLKLLVVLRVGYRLDKRSIAVRLKNKLEQYKVPMYYEEVASVCRTYNGKINRKAYV